ncbi:hypothetical protein [Streptomyces sp. NPDC051921]
MRTGELQSDALAMPYWRAFLEAAVMWLQAGAEHPTREPAIG